MVELHCLLDVTNARSMVTLEVSVHRSRRSIITLTDRLDLVDSLVSIDRQCLVN